MPDQIFISYRRDDAAYVTGHINDLLRKEFGDAAVFTDVDNIALGVDFRAVLDQTVSQCQVLLAVIGANWLTVRDQEGQPRLQDPADFVRIEIESALKRNIPVIPLLVSGAKMPTAEDLPGSLKGLAFRNGTQIRPAPDFGVDMARLIKNLQRHFDATRTESGDEPGIATSAPTRVAEPEESKAPERIEASHEPPAEDSESTGIRVQVAADERARKQAQLGSEQPSPAKRWSKRFALLVVVVALGTASYYGVWDPQKLRDFQTVVFGSSQNPDTGDGVEVLPPEDIGGAADIAVGPPDNLTDTVAGGADVDPSTGAEPKVPAGLATDETATDVDDALDAMPEAESEALDNLAADATNEPVDESAADPADATQTAGVTVDPPEATAGIVEGADASVTTTADETPAESETDEVVLSPGSQRKSEATEFISEGVRLAAIGDHEGAIQNFDEAIQLDVEPAFIYKHRGASYQALGQYEAAVNDYNEAIQLNSEDVNAFYNRGMSHFALENYPAAIADYNAAIQLDPEFVIAYSRRADAYEAMGNTDAAEIDRAAVAEFE